MPNVSVPENGTDGPKDKNIMPQVTGIVAAFGTFYTANKIAFKLF